MTRVGNGPLPVAGSVTSTSSGTPSKEGTPSTVRPGPASVVGQKRTPAVGKQVWPNGAGPAALALAGVSSHATSSSGSDRDLTREAARMVRTLSVSGDQARRLRGGRRPSSDDVNRGPELDVVTQPEVIGNLQPDAAVGDLTRDAPGLAVGSVDPHHSAALPVLEGRVVGSPEGVGVIAAAGWDDHKTLADPEMAGRRRRAGLADSDWSGPDLAAVGVERHPLVGAVDHEQGVREPEGAERAAADPAGLPVRARGNADVDPFRALRIPVGAEQQVDL